MTNEQIAQDVMGWTTRKEWHGSNYFDSTGKQQFYNDFLNDHNAAMMVVEKMREDGYRLITKYLDRQMVEFVKSMEDGSVEHFGAVYNENLCHAICSAALKAKGNK